jgi:hypothetical protein
MCIEKCKVRVYFCRGDLSCLPSSTFHNIALMQHVDEDETLDEDDLRQYFYEGHKKVRPGEVEKACEKLKIGCFWEEYTEHKNSNKGSHFVFRKLGWVSTSYECEASSYLTPYKIAGMHQIAIRRVLLALDQCVRTGCTDPECMWFREDIIMLQSK